MRKETFLPLLMACGTAAGFAGRTVGSVPPPNIILILADDLGHSDLSFQGGSVPTPHIDSLARNGVRFTQAYISAAVCSPSRAGLLTGRYQNRFGAEFLCDPGAPVREGYKIGIPVEEKTIADRMKALGYVTGCIGKWHVGFDPEFLPMNRGFDEFYGSPGQSSYFKAQLLDSLKSDKPVRMDEPGYYLTDDYSNRTVDFINRHKGVPFFLYVPHFAVHKPFEAAEKYLSRFPEIAEEKYRIRAGMMSALDDAVGALLDSLREHGLEENTLVVFLSDNGSSTGDGGNNSPFRGGKGSLWEGGIRTPLYMQWKGRIPAGAIYDEPVIALDLLPTAVAVGGGKPDPSWALDGVNLMPYLEGKEKGVPHDALFWRFRTQWAVRQGDWKLVQARETRGGSIQIANEGPIRLFNLREDPGEANDLAPAHPEKAGELREIWEQWSSRLPEPYWYPRPTD